MWFDHSDKSAPWHDLFHLRQKDVAPRELFLGAVFGLGETHLLMHRGGFAHESVEIIVVIY